MVSIQNLKNLFGLAKSTPRVLKSYSSVPTSAVRKGEVSLGGIDTTAILASEEADKFISSCKTGQNIVGDNIVRYGGSLPSRIITKRLPSGTIVSRRFDVAGAPSAKEVIQHDGTRAYNVGGSTGSTVVFNPRKGNTVSRYGHVEHMYTCPDINKTLAGNAVGMTEFANKDNAAYQVLKDAGMIASC